MKKIRLIITTLLIALLFSNCQKDDENPLSPVNVHDAQNWFEGYQSREVFDPMFENLNYDWHNATLKKLDDGFQAITVPIQNNITNPKYIGEQVLYLYPDKKQGYETILYEMTPEKGYREANLGKINLATFEGYMTVWDLKKGFIKGAKFVKNSLVADLAIKTKSIKTVLMAHKLIPLQEVVVERTGSSSGSKPMPNEFVSYYNSMGDTPGGKSGSGSSGPGSSAGSYVTNSKPTIDEPTDKIQVVKKIDASKLDPCTKAILDKLKNLSQNDFATLFAKLGDTNPNILITFQPNDPGLKNLAITYPVVGTELKSFNIDIKPEFLTNGTDLAIAGVMLHEMVHAYFTSLYGEQLRNENKDLKKFPELWDFYVRKKGGTTASDAQHNQIANSYVDAIAASLQEYSTGSITTSPAQLYKDLAWQGLSDTKAYNLLPQADRDRIIAVSYAEQKNTSTVNDNDKTIVKPQGKPCQK